jgi:hypothetical protein
MSRRLTVASFTLVLASAAALASAADSAAGALSARQALDRLKALAGEWQGTMMTKDGPPAAVRYEVVSGGHTVMERLFPGTDHEMISMYHLDGDRLVLTHFCAMGNQPRMQLERGTAQELTFTFAGGSNLDPQKDPHIHGGRLALPDADQLQAEWFVYTAGKQTATHKIFLTRKR